MHVFDVFARAFACCCCCMLLHGVACRCMGLHGVALFACFVVRALRVVTRC